MADVYFPLNDIDILINEVNHLLEAPDLNNTCLSDAFKGFQPQMVKKKGKKGKNNMKRSNSEFLERVNYNDVSHSFMNANSSDDSSLSVARIKERRAHSITLTMPSGSDSESEEIDIMIPTGSSVKYDSSPRKRDDKNNAKRKNSKRGEDFEKKRSSTETENNFKRSKSNDSSKKGKLDSDMKRNSKKNLKETGKRISLKDWKTSKGEDLFKSSREDEKKKNAETKQKRRISKKDSKKDVKEDVPKKKRTKSKHRKLKKLDFIEAEATMKSPKRESPRIKTPLLKKKSGKKHMKYRMWKKGVKASSSSSSHNEAKSMAYLQKFKVAMQKSSTSRLTSPRKVNKKTLDRRKTLFDISLSNTVTDISNPVLAASSDNGYSGDFYSEIEYLADESIDDFSLAADSSELAITSDINDVPLPKLNLAIPQYLSMHKYGASVVFEDHKLGPVNKSIHQLHPMTKNMMEMNGFLNDHSMQPIKSPRLNTANDDIRWKRSSDPTDNSQKLRDTSKFVYSLPEFPTATRSFTVDFDKIESIFDSSTLGCNIIVGKKIRKDYRRSSKKKTNLLLNSMIKKLYESDVHMICDYCDLPILYKYRKLDCGNYHTEHLRCPLCSQKLFNENYQLCKETNKFYCVECYSKSNYQGVCFQCQNPIYGEFSERDQNKFHPLHLDV